MCGWLEALLNETRSSSPSRARRVGPGMRSLYVQAGNLTPGMTSTSRSVAYSSHSRTTRPLGRRRVVPQSKSRRIS